MESPIHPPVYIEVELPRASNQCLAMTGALVNLFEHPAFKEIPFVKRVVCMEMAKTLACTAAPRPTGD